jgi:hypothetical protein
MCLHTLPFGTQTVTGHDRAGTHNIVQQCTVARETEQELAKTRPGDPVHNTKYAKAQADSKLCRSEPKRGTAHTAQPTPQARVWRDHCFQIDKTRRQVNKTDGPVQDQQKKARRSYVAAATCKHTTLLTTKATKGALPEQNTTTASA